MLYFIKTACLLKPLPKKILECICIIVKISFPERAISSNKKRPCQIAFYIKTNLIHQYKITITKISQREYVANKEV